jgi:hypothetical protein
MELDILFYMFLISGVFSGIYIELINKGNNNTVGIGLIIYLLLVITCLLIKLLCKEKLK